ncbi:hypothetical protein Pcac1_g4634 [Phytophthora cactorum]|nr:hypothetical protein Pcac1_g4634 [Phytophthora cactorum]
MRQFWGINFHAHVMALSPAWPSSGGHPHQDSLLSSAKPSVTGSSFLLGHSEPFWICQWVDDIVLIEIDVGDRLQKAEKRIKDGVKLVFGSDGWHEGKFTTWSRVFHAVGIDWNIPDGCITVPHRHNKAGRGNKLQTFDGKVAAVAFAHKVVRNVRINYHDPEFELVSKGYKRTQGQVDRKQPVTTQMLLAIRELLGEPDKQAEVMWGSVVLGFFFLDRSSELWDLSQLTVRQGQNGFIV